MKAPKGGEQLFQKSVTDKRPDQIFRKTKIISTLGKHTSNLVRDLSLIYLGSNMQAYRARH